MVGTVCGESKRRVRERRAARSRRREISDNALSLNAGGG